MVTITERRRTEEEQQLFDQWRDRYRAQWHHALTKNLPALFFTWLAGAVLLFRFIEVGLKRQGIDSPSSILVVTVVTAMIPAIAAYAWAVRSGIRWRVSPERKACEEKLDQDLADDQVRVVSFDIVSAIEVQEYEDEGAHWYCLLRDGTVVYLNGQEYYAVDPADEPELSEEQFREEYGDDWRFPCDCLQVVETRFGKQILRYVRSSEPVSVEHRFPPYALEVDWPPFTQADREDYPPESPHAYRIEIPWEELIKRLEAITSEV